MKDRRTFPRYPITFPVGIRLTGPDKNISFNTQCVNISCSSIEISCEKNMVEALLAQDDYPHTGQLEFEMPGDGSKYRVQGQVVTHRRLAQNHYYLVLVFNEFSKGTDEHLAEELLEFETDGFNLGSS